MDQLSPDKAYIRDYLWLPKSKINVQAVKRGLEVYPTVNSNYAKAAVRLWTETEDHVLVPRYYISPGDYGRYKFPFVDVRPKSFPKIRIQHRVTPRDESQAKAIEILEKSENGILNLACGKGKTTIALAAIANIGVPAIVIVNNRSLMTQWEEMIRKHWKYEGDIGIVQQDVFDWEHPITLAMIHTLAQKSETWPDEFREYFGIAIYDEVHHLSAPTFVRTAHLFMGRRWGLTATANRPDGLEVVIYHHLGRPIYKDLGQSLIPEAWFFQTQVAPDSKANSEYLFNDRGGQENISLIRAWLGANSTRNEIILREIRKAAKSGRKILAVTHSIEQAKTLHAAYEGSGLCVGSMDPAERLKMIQQRQVSFATIQIAGEALDAPSLDTLFILTPFGDHNTLQQCLGRIQRSYPGKKPPMALIFEDNIGYCHALCGKLRQFLKKNGYPIHKAKGAVT